MREKKTCEKIMRIDREPKSNNEKSLHCFRPHRQKKQDIIII
jgi:hypothetical protein